MDSTVSTVAPPDLLAPAGSWDCAKAAIENGADAIYFGLERFNARMRAQNFTAADLPQLMKFLHHRGVKGYVTLNTLIFPKELPEAEQYLRTMIAAGVDAAIVQDVGICRLIRHLSPDFPIHASTQMTITSAAGVEFAKSLGCQLVVLARECSLREIHKIQQQIGERDTALPLEVFVHGALCVAYSGQCLTSEALGGRSANRGECAQACRMPYELIADGKRVDLGDRKYLLSPQDLAGLDVLPELVKTGVTCLKIEGRLKTPEYVANVTRVYRQALDRVMGGEREEGRGKGETRGDGEQSTISNRQSTIPLPANLSPQQSKIQNLKSTIPPPSDRYNLEMAFSRGLYTGWFGGINNQELVHARFAKKRGVYLGEVVRVQGEQVTVKLTSDTSQAAPLRHKGTKIFHSPLPTPHSPPPPIKPGDGVVFDNGHPEVQEEGGRVYQVEQNGQTVVLTFGQRDLSLNRVRVGDRVWKTSDPELDRQLRQSFAGDTAKFQRPIQIEVHGEGGQACVAIARDELRHVVQVESAMPLTEARTQPLTTERLQEQFGRLGNTPFRLGDLINHLSPNLMLPISELNRLRREMVAQLEDLRSQPKRWQLHSNASFTDLLPHSPSPHLPTPHSPLPTSPSLIVLVHNLQQLQAALQSNVQTLYCELEDPRAYREAVQMVRQAAIGTGQAGEVGKVEDTLQSSIFNLQSSIFVAPPRITKPNENWILQQVRACKADGYLIRNYDQLAFFAGDRGIGDFSLNVANPLTANYFKQQFGLERLTASYDLNIGQLKDLLISCSPDWFEVTIHQHMPMFHMEHCVFCAFLSEGTDYTNCGRPCEKHQVKLQDRVGTDHILQADAGCRNTVFNGIAQTGAEYVKRLLELGLRHFRIEFVDETPEQVTQTIDCYHQLLQGEMTGTQLWRSLKLQSQLGVTRGTMEAKGMRR